MKQVALVLLLSTSSIGLCHSDLEYPFQMPRYFQSLVALIEFVSKRDPSSSTKVENFASFEGAAIYLVVIQVGSGRTLFENYIYGCKIACDQLLMYASGTERVLATWNKDDWNVVLRGANGKELLRAKFETD